MSPQAEHTQKQGTLILGLAC